MEATRALAVRAAVVKTICGPNSDEAREAQARFISARVAAIFG